MPPASSRPPPGDGTLPAHELTALAERSGGNPLFLRELGAVAGSATLDQALPDTVEDLMTAGSTGSTRPTARSCGMRRCSGATFPLSVLVEMLGGEEERPDELAWRRLGDFVTEVEPGTFRFRAALLRDAAYEGLPYRRRRELHAAAGDAIARASDAEAGDRAAILSMHFFHAHRYEEAWSYARVAADRARGKYALVDAGALYRRAIDAARLVPGMPTARSWKSSNRAATCSTASAPTTRQPPVTGQPVDSSGATRSPSRSST